MYSSEESYDSQQKKIQKIKYIKNVLCNYEDTKYEDSYKKIRNILTRNHNNFDIKLTFLSNIKQELYDEYDNIRLYDKAFIIYDIINIEEVLEDLNITLSPNDLYILWKYFSLTYSNEEWMEVPSSSLLIKNIIVNMLLYFLDENKIKELSITIDNFDDDFYFYLCYLHNKIKEEIEMEEGE